MNDMSLKARIRNIAKSKNISAQAVLQNYLMNRFLHRLSLTKYRDKFVIKGGLLISSIIGIEHRSTMDIDTTLRNLQLTEASVKKAIETVCEVKEDDGIVFYFDSIEPIRNDDEYGGYRVIFHAVFGKINAPMSMDISTGDVITPGAEKHIFSDLFDEKTKFELWSYTVETVLAEKVETILSRGTNNTRPRDFYDVYMLSTADYNREIFNAAFEATSAYRESLNKIRDYEKIINAISNDGIMNRRWEEYVKQMPYAEGIAFSDTIDAVKRLMGC